MEEIPSPLHRTRDGAHVVRALQDLLELLAPVMFAHGITPATITDLAKNALVISAARNARMSTGRVNQSRVAAVTGLTRAEVRRRLAAPSRLAPPSSRALDRSARVVAGWLRDPAFLDRHGKPRKLTLNAGAYSFAELVRLHSGDVPPRVVLEQLKTRGLVRLETNGVSLRSRRKAFGGAPPSALLDVFPYVSDLLSTAATERGRLAYAQRVHMIADTESQAILLTDRVVRTLAATSAALAAVATTQHAESDAPSKSGLTIAMTLVTKPIASATSRRRVPVASTMKKK
jgi:hypothetical protein